MRLLQLTSSFPLQPASISGIFIYRLVCHLPEDIETIVLTPDSRNTVDVPPGKFQLKRFRYAPKTHQTLAHEAGGLPAALRGARLNLFFLPAFFISMLWWTFYLGRKAEVIHAHWTINGVIAGIVGYLTKKPVVTTLRGEDVNRVKSSILHRLLLLACLKCSAVVVTVSGGMRKLIIDQFPKYASKVTCIPNGVSDQFYAIEHHENRNNLALLVLGSLIPVKGLDLVIGALAKGCRTRQWQLLIAGDGPEKEGLQAMILKEGLEKRVKFIGRIPPNEVPELLGGTDILIQASYREGRPNAIVEAMAAAVPVIGSDINGIAELIDHGKNGLLFSAGKIDELASQLQSLLDSPELRARIGVAGRQTLLDQNLTWKGCASSYTAIYKHLIEA